MTDQNTLTATGTERRHLHMNLGHQRTGRIKDLESPGPGFFLHRPGHAVGTEYDNGVIGYFVELFNKHRAPLAQVVDHEAVVNNLMTDINRTAEDLQGSVDDVDSAINAGAEAARVG